MCVSQGETPSRLRSQPVVVWVIFLCCLSIMYSLSFSCHVRAVIQHVIRNQITLIRSSFCSLPTHYICWYQFYASLSESWTVQILYHCKGYSDVKMLASGLLHVLSCCSHTCSCCSWSIGRRCDRSCKGSWRRGSFLPNTALPKVSRCCILCNLWMSVTLYYLLHQPLIFQCLLSVFLQLKETSVA